ncbi:MAG: hypothetical protein HC893_00615, partial [Chloroflexaceae bacterium]|nr:hypothetical protein [Chloroflexaceae bacterium]
MPIEGGQPGTILGDVYSILDLNALLERIETDLELLSDASLLAVTPGECNQNEDIVSSRVADEGNTTIQSITFCLANSSMNTALRLDIAGISEIVSSGLYVTLVSSGITLGLLIVVGA